MTWRDDLRKVAITINGKQRTLVGASFRGVAFLVESSELAGGRRTVTHEFPFRDDPYLEDLGKRARTVRLEAYLLGDEYLAQRDTLLSALEDESGPGQLVHPYYGLLTVVCTTVSIRETKTDGGYAAFSLEFAEAPTQTPAPVAVTDAAAQVAASALTASAANDAELTTSFNASGLPGYAFVSTATSITQAANAVTKYITPILTDTQELASMTTAVAQIVAQATTLATTPLNVIGQLRDALAAATTAIQDAPESFVDALVSAYSVDLGTPVAPTTTARAQEAPNQTAVQAALRRVFAVMAAQLAPTVPFTSIDDALAARDSISTLLDTEAATAGDDAYGALVDLRSQLQQAVPGSSTFARVVTVTQNQPVSALKLAYQLYGSVDLESDLLARNSVVNPCFVVGDLKALSNGD